MRFEEQRQEEHDEHDAGGPVEDLKWKGRSQGWVRRWFGLAKDEAANETDSSGEYEEEERVDDSVPYCLVRLEEELRVFKGEEDGVKDSVEGEQAEEKSDGFGEFEQHAQGPLHV